jgi:hypothetical protein
LIQAGAVLGFSFEQSIIVLSTGQCDLCGESAGWFNDRHSICELRADGLKVKLAALALNGTLAGKTFEEISAEAGQLAAADKLSVDRYNESLLQGANDAASQIALKSPVPEEELSRLVRILQGFGINGYTRKWAQRRWFAMAQLSMSCNLWQVLHGVTPFYDGDGRMQFNLHAGEQPVFSIGKATFAEERTVSQGRVYSGVSLPVGLGMYYHMGSSQGQQVSGLQPLDVGEMLITDHTLYFGGQRRTLRIPLTNVVRYQSYVDGIGVCESHGSPKVFVPDYSGMDTGWFLFNLLTALTSRLSQS